MGTRAIGLSLALAVVLGPPPASARTAVPTSIGTMARSAARVFRGRCTAVRVETVDVAGARLPVTAYTFAVREHLKGSPRTTVTFRQVGTPDGGPRDLGRLVGLPVYAPGSEYVLFLLPESRAGVTAPAGAAEGAFLVRDDAVMSIGGPAAPVAAPVVTARGATVSADGEARRSYRALRRAVLDELAR